MGRRETWVESNGFFGTFDCCVELPCSTEHRDEGLGIVGLACHRLADAFGGRRVTSADMFDEPEMMPGESIGRVLREYLRVEIARIS